MCGRELCCTLFFDEVEPVSMRLARSQNLAANPLQIQGICGKLLCCLAFEHPLYVDFLKQAPQIGEQVTTPDGPAGWSDTWCRRGRWRFGPPTV